MKMKAQKKMSWKFGIVSTTILATMFYMHNNPDESRTFLLNRIADAHSLKDNVVMALDTDGDRCLQNMFCVSVGGYLKSKISEFPLDQETARFLPSFTGEEYPASPFIHQI